MSAVDVRSETGAEELLTVSSSQGVIPRSAANVSMFKAASYVGHKLCWPDDLVINSLWAWGRGLGIARHHGIVSTAYGVYRQRQQHLLPQYLHHLVRSTSFQWELQVRSQGVWKSRLQMTDARWLDAPLLIPPAEEQAAIIKYLAHANARIDNAIIAKRRLIALCTEEQQAVAREWLTPGARVQGTWETVVTKRFCRITTGGEDSGNAVDEGGYPFFVRGRQVLRASDYSFDAEAVMTPGDGQGGVGKVFHYFNGKFQAHQRVYVFLNFQGVNARYFYWNLRAFFRAFALSQSNTVTMESLRMPVIAYFPVSFPAIDEQAQIVGGIERETARIQEQIDVAEAEINLLREFRTRLVADVVTGQIDVRGIADALPDVDADAAWGDPSLADATDSPELDDVLTDSEA